MWMVELSGRDRGATEAPTERGETIAIGVPICETGIKSEVFVCIGVL